MKRFRFWFICLAWAFLVQPGRGATSLDLGSDQEMVDALLQKAERGQDFVSIDDMNFKVSFLQQQQALQGQKKTNSASPTGTTKWPNGVVPFVFAGNTTAQMRSQFLAAAAEWSTAAGVNFVARTTEANYVFVEDSDGNNSYVGMQGGSQTINIYNWTYRFIICHEIAHALGMCHEQSRSDRDTYVTINTDNIESGMEYNFSKQATSNATTYDFGSIMHYGARDFSINGSPTIVAKPAYASQAANMGQRDGLSGLDKQGMVALYGSPGRPNLTTFIAPSWSAEVVVSSAPGSTTDTPLLASDTVFLDFAVENSGQASAGACSTQIYLDNALVKTISLASIAAGNSILTTDVNLGSLAAGSHTLRVKIDSANTVPEIDETDNEFTKSITVGPPGTPNLTSILPNGWSDKLVVSSTTNSNTDTSALFTTDNLFFDATIQNAGTATSAGFNVQILLDGTLFQTRVIAGLTPKASAVITDLNLGSLSAGGHVVSLKIDSSSAVAESNEADNEFSKSFTIIARPNLTLIRPAGWTDKIVASKITNTNVDELIHPGDPVFLDFAVQNTAAGATTAEYTVELFIDNALRSKFTGSSTLNPGSSDIWQDVPLGVLSNGLHSIKVRIDTTNAISEASELDNELTKTINVVQAPVIYTHPANTIISTGQSATLSVGASGSDLNFQWYQGTSGTTAMAVGTNAPMFTTPALGGSASYWVRVSNAGGMLDSATAVVTVGATPSASATHAGPSAYTPGQSITINTTFTYTGILRALSWQPVLPAGWSISGVTGNGNFQLQGTTIVWPTDSLPPSPVAMTYTVDVPADSAGEQKIRGLVSYQLNGDPVKQVAANSDPLLLSLVPRPALVLQGLPTGGGVITATPSPDSAGRYAPGAVVTLSATPSAHYRFLSWTADATGTSNSVQITMDQDRTVTAHFQELSATTRTLPETYLPGKAVTVSIAAAPGGGTGQYTVEEHLPAGWTALAINEGGSYSASTGQVTWGPFADHTARTLTYLATSPATAEGVPSFTGSGSFDGETVATLGSTTMVKGEVFQMTVRPGTYYGLIQNAAGQIPTPAQNGTVTLKLTARGTYSAQVIVGGNKASFKGMFDATTGQAPVVGVSSKNFPAAQITLQIDARDQNGKITGTVAAGGTVTALEARRATFNKRTNPDPHAGRYTLAISTKSGATAAAYPPGSSVGAVTIGPDGMGKVVGILADGTKFTGASGVAADGSWPFYSLLPKSGGYLGGWIYLARDPQVSDGAGQVTWVKKPASSSPFYSQGFSKEQDALVSKYEHTRNQLVLPLRDGSGNARLSIAGGDLLAVPSPRTLSVNAAGKVYDFSGERFKMTLNVTTGLFTGYFPDLNTGQPHPFQGAIFQAQGIGLGWFEGTTVTGSIRLSPAP